MGTAPAPPSFMILCNFDIFYIIWGRGLGLIILIFVRCWHRRLQISIRRQFSTQEHVGATMGTVPAPPSFMILCNFSIFYIIWGRGPRTHDSHFRSLLTQKAPNFNPTTDFHTRCVAMWKSVVGFKFGALYVSNERKWELWVRARVLIWCKKMLKIKSIMKLGGTGVVLIVMSTCYYVEFCCQI